jgi:hypothetical protein
MWSPHAGTDNQVSNDLKPRLTGVLSLPSSVLCNPSHATPPVTPTTRSRSFVEAARDFMFLGSKDIKLDGEQLGGRKGDDQTIFYCCFTIARVASSLTWPFLAKPGIHLSIITDAPAGAHVPADAMHAHAEHACGHAVSLTRSSTPPAAPRLLPPRPRVIDIPDRVRRRGLVLLHPSSKIRTRCAATLYSVVTDLSSECVEKKVLGVFGNDDDDVRVHHRPQLDLVH